MMKIYSKLLTLMLVLSSVSVAYAQEETFSADGFECKIIANDAVEITGATTPATGTLIIPATIGNYTVTAIGDGAFKTSAITELDCSAATGLQRIGESAFADCNQLTTVKFPALDNSSLTEIGALAFQHDTALSSINLEDTRIKVMEALFTKDMNDEVYFDDLLSLQLPETLKEIKSYALQFLGLRSITIPSSVKAFGEGVLEGTIYLEEFYWKGAKVNSLPRNTFLGEDALKVVYFLTNKPIERGGLSDLHFYMCHKDQLNVYVTQELYDNLIPYADGFGNAIYSTLVAVTDWEPDPEDPDDPDDPSAIAAPRMIPADGAIYTLQGVRVNQPRKGQLYIQNGKKYVK